MNLIQITLPLPDKRLRGNARGCTRGAMFARAGAAKSYRRTAYWTAREAMRGSVAPMWERAVSRVIWFLPKHGKCQDQDNAIRSLKAAFDGLQDAGVLDNDRGLVHAEHLFASDWDRPRVEITVKPLPEKGDRPIADD